MAYIPNMTDDQSKNPAQGVVAPGDVGGTPTGAASGVGSASPGATSGPQQSGGNFATLQTYLNANQGQAPGLTDKITSGINQQYNTLQGQNQQVLQGVQNQVGQGYTAQNNDILAQEAANPVSFASNPGNIQSFQKQLTDKYTGPASAESTGAFSNQLANVNNAISTGKNQTGTEAGREQLLSQNEARPTTGVTALNSAILTQDPNSLSKVQNAYQPFSNLISGLTTGAQGIDTSITSAQNEAKSASDKANQQISAQVQGLNQSLTNTANQDIAAQNKYNQDLQSFQNTWNPFSTAVNSVNEVDKQYFPNFGQVTNPFTSSLNMPTSNQIYTPQSVATSDQANQGQAFQSLMNGLNLGLPMPRATQAGTATAPGIAPSLDKIQIAQQLARAEQSAIKPLQTYQDTQNWQQVNPEWTNYNNLLKQLDPNVWGEI